MEARLKRTNRKRLASLSALSAGALGVAAIPASANDIVFSGVIHAEVGYPYGKYTMQGPEGAGAIIQVVQSCQVTCFNSWYGVAAYSKAGKHGTEVRFLATGPRNSWALGEPLAAVWGTAAGKSTKSADIWFSYDFGGAETKFNATDRYLLFRFQGGALKHDMYGWARLKVTQQGIYLPQVDLVDWAYDPSGVRLPAGYHGSGQTDQEGAEPMEPSTLDVTGLPALALGASGLRRMRTARHGETSTRY